MSDKREIAAEVEDDFDLRGFLPYVLNLAAEETSAAFQRYYKERYGMLRTEWRTLFHLGRYGDMTAKDICDRARIHKTKVSRAVAALAAKRFLVRTPREDDRRHERLSLTAAGRAAYADLNAEARRFDRELMSEFQPEEERVLRAALIRLARL